MIDRSLKGDRASAAAPAVKPVIPPGCEPSCANRAIKPRRDARFDRQISGLVKPAGTNFVARWPT
jgi:hypothetical protein